MQWVIMIILLFHSPRVDIYISETGGWALDNMHHEPMTHQLLLGLDIKKGTCVQLDGRGAIIVQVRNKRTGISKWIRDCGVKVREGATFSGWKETLVEDAPIVIEWNDDEQMRIRYRRMGRDRKLLPTRLLVFLPAGQVLGQRQQWEITGAKFVPGMVEVRKCD